MALWPIDSNVQVNVYADARLFLAAYDSGELGDYVSERTAEAIADFWVESQFARTDVYCDWDDATAAEAFSAMRRELQALGVD